MTIETTAGYAKRHLLCVSEMSIGRHPSNVIPIPVPQVSMRHCSLHQQNGRLILMNRGSANGVYLRGERVPDRIQREVMNGDILWLGAFVRLTVRFVDEV